MQLGIDWNATERDVFGVNPNEQPTQHYAGNPPAMPAAVHVPNQAGRDNTSTSLPTGQATRLTGLAIPPSSITADTYPPDHAATPNVSSGSSQTGGSSGRQAAWIPQELTYARQLRAQGWTMAAIGRALNRTPNSVGGKLWRDNGGDPKGAEKQRRRKDAEDEEG